MVEYADYQCPYCEKFFNNVWPDLKAKYVDTGEIKFIYQDFAFLGPDSNTAAEASHCAADQNKFWQYHDYLFIIRVSEGTAGPRADHQKEFAKALGLNTAQFNSSVWTAANISRKYWMKPRPAAVTAFPARRACLLTGKLLSAPSRHRLLNRP